MTFSASFIEQVQKFGERGRHCVNEGLTSLLARRHLQAGDVAFDVGANRGDLTRPFAELVGDKGIVHAFEPNPEHWRTLSSIGKNVRLWPYAAGDNLSLCELYVPENLDGWASLVDIRGLLPSTRFDIRSAVQVPIDSISELADLPCKFIKIDAERHEFNVLRGAKNLIGRFAPLVVFENATDDVLSFFSENQYIVIDMFGYIVRDNSCALPNHIAISRRRFTSIADVIVEEKNAFGLLDFGYALDRQAVS